MAGASVASSCWGKESPEVFSVVVEEEEAEVMVFYEREAARVSVFSHPHGVEVRDASLLWLIPVHAFFSEPMGR